MQIDSTTYNKAAHFAPGHGYEARTAAPTSIIVHSTSSSTKNTAFAAEARYLYEAALVGAHYLVGKDGAIVQFLDPLAWAAWHAGRCQGAYLNQHSIGIELHHSVGDPPYPSAQLGALSALLVSLMEHFAIPKQLIETHGQVAILGPYQRKTDPADWSHQDFLTFRSHLPSPTILHTVTAGPYGAIAQQSRDAHALAARGYQAGELIKVDDFSEGWFHDASGAGFIPSGQVQA